MAHLPLVVIGPRWPGNRPPGYRDEHAKHVHLGTMPPRQQLTWLTCRTQARR